MTVHGPAVSPPQTSRSGATVLVDALVAQRVPLVFGLPGVHNLAAWEALDGAPLRLVGVRHEQTAVYAADGYARATGRLGVAITTTGPGAANTLGATGEAWASGSPVVVIATDIPTTLRRPGTYRGVLHETRDQGAMFAPVVKQVLRVTCAAEIGETIARAAATALAAPTGPVYVEIPTDLLSVAVPATDTAGAAAADPPPSTRRPVDPTRVAAAAALLRHAQRPLIWAGGGALRANAGDAVAALATRLGAPVIETYTARGLIDREHPGHVGVVPHLPEIGQLWDEADVVLAVGSDFDGMMTQNWRMPAPRRLVAVNVDAADAGKAYPPDVLLQADARDGCDALRRELGDGAPAVSPADLAARLATLHDGIDARVRADDPDAASFLGALRDVLPPETTLVVDMCIPGYWIGAMHRVTGPRRFAYPVGWGTLGFGFPASIGAALAGTGPTLAVCGDGGFLFATGELATLRQEQVPVTVLLFDDGGYGMLRFDQDHAGTARVGTDLESPDFQGLAEAFGIPAETVDGTGDALAGALRRSLAIPGPSMVVARASMRPPESTSPRWYRPALPG